MKEYCYGNLAQANQPQANQPQANQPQANQPQAKQPQAMPFFLRLDKISPIRITLWTRDGFFKKLTDSSCMGIWSAIFLVEQFYVTKIKWRDFYKKTRVIYLFSNLVFNFIWFTQIKNVSGVWQKNVSASPCEQRANFKAEVVNFKRKLLHQSFPPREETPLMWRWMRMCIFFSWNNCLASTVNKTWLPLRFDSCPEFSLNFYISSYFIFYVPISCLYCFASVPRFFLWMLFYSCLMLMLMKFWFFLEVRFVF